MYVKFHILGWFIKQDICVKKNNKKNLNLQIYTVVIFQVPFFFILFLSLYSLIGWLSINV